MRILHTDVMCKYGLLNWHGVNDVRQMEICVHTTEPQVS